MKARCTNRFVRKFPGPFHYQPGEDGVDHTFNVICINTGELIVSTYYWEARQEAKAVAKLVADALNASCGWPEFVKDDPDTETIAAIFPGPFMIRSASCDYRGPLVEVICQTTHDQLVGVYERSRPDEHRLIATQIAFAVQDFVDAQPVNQRHEQEAS